MFKRITKKQKKQERDEELGLDDETKQVLGMHDTDTDESDSDSDSDLSDDGGLDVELGSDAEMKTDWLAVEGEDSEDEDESNEEGLDLDEELDGESPITLLEAVKTPVYLVSLEPDVRACIVCPKKLLKNSQMVDVHVESAAHLRRYKRFCELAQRRKYQTKDPRSIAATLSQPQKAVPADAQGLSHRALKRKAKTKAIKKKREVTKQIIERKRQERAMKGTHTAVGGDATDSNREETASGRPQKRRKVAKDAGAGGETADILEPAAKAKAPESKAKASAKGKVNAEEVEERTDAEATALKPKAKAGDARDKSSTQRTKADGKRSGPAKLSVPSQARSRKDKSKARERSSVHSSRRRYFDSNEEIGETKEVKKPDAGVKNAKMVGDAGESEGLQKQTGNPRKKRRRKGAKDLILFD